jgi:multimeric flavodoxin WrbA
MKAILLDASNVNDLLGQRTRELLENELHTRGWETTHIALDARKIGNCAGDFFCWVRTPGMCNVNDDNREIAAEIVNSDLMIYLTEVTFGGYSSSLKRVVDHQIQNIMPFFASLAGETHHQKRYSAYPDFLAIGWTSQVNEQAGKVFRQLCARNALNFYAKNFASAIISGEQPDAEKLSLLRGGLDDLRVVSKSLGLVEASVRPSSGDHVHTSEPISKVVLLVGSPRTRKSTSYSLGGYLGERISHLTSIQVETIHLYTVLRSKEKMRGLLEAVDAADVILLAFPLYVDSLPAPVIEAMERIAVHRQESTEDRPALFAAIANCGFPEARHCETALAICEVFARQAGFTWAGSLALGAGEGLVHGAQLAGAGGPAVVIRQALDLAAAALAEGRGIPASVAATLAKTIIPGWVYRIMGSVGWKLQAKKFGVGHLLKRKTYQPKS